MTRSVSNAMLLLATCAFLLLPVQARGAGNAPLLFTAAPDDATVEATVTRPGVAAPLPASLVPALQRGDRVHIVFPSSESAPGPAQHRFHALVAFIGLTASFRPAKDPGHSLFADHRANDGRSIDFTYDPQLGTPVIFLFPEDRQTRSVDGVRDYVLDHPAQFLGSATVAATSDDRQVWLSDFIASPPANISTATTSFVPVVSTAYDAAVSLLTGIWNEIRKPKQNYEFIPAALTNVTNEPGVPPHQELVPAAPAKWNPPSGVSSALFFTIGRGRYDSATDPQPAIVDAESTGKPICLLDRSADSPLKLNRASAYVPSGTLAVYRAGSDQLVRSVPLKAADLTAPKLDSRDFPPGAYDVTLSAPLGFGTLSSPQKVRVVRPASQNWVTERPLKIVAGLPKTTLDFSSPFAPCVSAAELVDANLDSIAATVIHPSAEHVALQFDTSKLTPGDATVRIHQGDAVVDRVRYFSALPYPEVTGPVKIYDGDGSITLSGKRLGLVSALTLKSAGGAVLLSFARQSPTPPYDADGSAATFIAAHGRIDARAQPAILALSYSDGRAPNEVTVEVQAPRPSIATVNVTASPSAGGIVPLQSTVLYSGESAQITVAGEAGAVYPDKATLRLRKASSAQRFGDAATTTPLATVRQSGGRTLQASLDLAAQLGDALNERLQVQVYDPDRQLGSDWVTLDRRFVPSASIDQIDCSGATPSAGLCKMYGENLSRVKEVSNGATASEPQPCPQPQATRSCVLVGDYSKYFITMYGDAPDPTFAVSDSIVKR